MKTRLRAGIEAKAARGELKVLLPPGYVYDANDQLVMDPDKRVQQATRGRLPMEVVEKVEGGRLRVRTPPDPRTGLVEKILDPLELIHALTTQIHDPGQHMVRYYGWYSNRSRGARAAGGLGGGVGQPTDTSKAGPARDRPPRG